MNSDKVPGRSSVSRAARFSSAYSYARANASATENAELYGRWSAVDGLGCNFRIECTFEGDIDPLTGMVANLIDIDSWMSAAVNVFDHRDLTQLQVVNRHGAATADAIAAAFEEVLVAAMPPQADGVRLTRLRLWEGDSSCVDRARREWIK